MMANTTQPWLEDLSEEWVPLPTPQTNAASPDSPAATQASRSVPAKSKSRLPRMRQSSGSFSEIQVKNIARELRPPKQRSALVERSLSDNNIAPNSSAIGLDAPSGSGSFAQSFASQDSIMYGTVAHNIVAKSPTKDQGSHGTPEWRKRLVKGELGYGDQTDLFGNTGLQNIFQKPIGNVPDDVQPPKGKLGLLKGLAAIPSSPPPWLSEEQQCGNEEHLEEEIERGHAQDHGQDASEGLSAQLSAQSLEESSVIHAPSTATQSGLRTVSGQIEFDNESFSPVYLTTNLKVGQTPNPVPNFRGSELANRLRQIGSPPSQPQTIREETYLTHGQDESSLIRSQDESLPEGLPAGTPDYAGVSRFVELRRGGYSRDGSFRRRPLSPSPERVRSIESERVARQHESHIAIVTVEDTGSAKDLVQPKTPRHDGQQHLSPDRARNSGSPLKLFDAHDTFTSNRLQRRLSQLEYKSEKTTPNDDETQKIDTTKLAQRKSTLTSVEEVSFVNHDASKPAENRGQTPHRVESFGQGELNRYQFSGDFSAASYDDDSDRASTPDGSPPMDIKPPGSRPPLKFQFDDSPISRSQSRRSVSQLAGVDNRPKFQRHRSISSTRSEENSEAQVGYSEGKRGPTSPFKNPISKRRRTLQSADIEQENNEEPEVSVEVEPRDVQGTKTITHSLIGKKRKDARHDSYSNIADAETLSRRHILRPRNPTPSQRRRDELQAEILEATEAFIMSSPELDTICEQFDSTVASNDQMEQAQATAIAGEVAAFSMKQQKAFRNETRKRSVTTQDFLDEALKIMEHIRTKGRPSSGLGSLEETEAESEVIEDPTTHLSSSLTFERPPSREGRLSAWKEPNKQQLDPAVMSHLRKYQEKDSDTFLNSSINSLPLSRVQGAEHLEEKSLVIEQDDIRITDNPNRYASMGKSGDDHVDSQPQTNGTQQSHVSSLGQTIVTNASRRSDHVANLAPEAVAHLIPQEIAGMSFDREKNMWVRQKSPSKEHRQIEEEVSAVNDSEEDPFGQIPDLTVDDTKEKEVRECSPVRPKPTAETLLEDDEEAEVEEEERPVTREGKGTAYTDTSSVPSKMSNFAWSFPKTDTRASSWSTQAPRNWSTQKAMQPQTTYAIPESEEDDIEHEIKYFEGRGHAPPSVQNHHRRDITISLEEHDVRNTEQTRAKSHSINQTQWVSARTQHSSDKEQSTRAPLQSAKSLPLARTGRAPMFSGDGDLSILDELSSKNYRMQLSMSVSAPVLVQGGQDGLLAPTSPIKGDVTFMLSDLPEFTLNQVDEFELPDRVIMKHDGTRFSRELEDRYAQGTADLVKALQDVEPDEPYWEDLRKVDIHDKGLSTLHRLNEFCYQLEELDVSGNSISDVKGIPYTMRRLQIQNNCLTRLTSWAALLNLQYLDITGNDIDSLDGLAELVHLRVLKADNNKIASLDSILHLDGLMELSACGNLIETIDFERSDLKSLTDVDLRNNRIFEVRNLHRLPRLEHIDLNDNEMDEFPHYDDSVARCKSLRSLRICRNGLTFLDMDGYFPTLEKLYVDGNSLTHIPGLEHLQHLRTFSAREQMLNSDSDTEICVSNLMRNCDVRNLYLSSNATHGLEISQHLLNLQRLELASMGLKELPDNFGQLTPNIRSINLNFNSIKDLRPLLNIKRLNELLLAGNKLERLRANALVLGKLGTLTKLDWRDNPITLRFYASTSENRIMSLRKKPSDDQVTDRFVLPDGDAEVDVQHLARLDFETRIRRRVTEMMLANLCKNLRELDGLRFDKTRVLVKDEIWERMLLLGVIQRKQTEE